MVSTLSVVRLPESRRPETHLDLPAVGLVSGGAVSGVWGLVRAGEVGWRSLDVVAALSLGALLLAGFVAWERRSPHPMLPLRLFRSYAFTAASVTSFLMTGGLFAGAFLVSQYLQVVVGSSPFDAGLRFLPMTATPLFVSPATGVLSDRVGRRPVMVVGMLLLGSGLAWFALVGTTSAGYEQLVLPLLVAGIGASMPFATAPAAALSAVSPADMDKASGATNSLQRFGSAFAISATTAVFAANGHLGAAASFDAGFRPALALAAGLALLGAISALGVASRQVLARGVRSSAPVPAAQ